MKIGFIGAGKVGTSLGRYITERKISDVCVSGYYSQCLQSAEYASRCTNSACFTHLNVVVEASDILFLTVPDGKLASVWEMVRQLNVRNRIFCHCSGAFSSDVFYKRADCSHYGYSIHPLFPFCSKDTPLEAMEKIHFTVEGDENYLPFWRELLQSLGNQVKIISVEDKVKYHGAAVFSSNLVLATLKVACDLMEECGFSNEEAQNALRPIVTHNITNFSQVGLSKALTGPVERGDEETVAKHLGCLTGEQREIYRLLSVQLVPMAQEKTSDLKKIQAFQVIQQLLQ